MAIHRHTTESIECDACGDVIETNALNARVNRGWRLIRLSIGMTGDDCSIERDMCDGCMRALNAMLDARRERRAHPTPTGSEG